MIHLPWWAFWGLFSFAMLLGWCLCAMWVAWRLPRMEVIRREEGDVWLTTRER